MRKATTGFTLVEIMIVLAVLAILVLAVIPEYGTASQEARESSLATNLQTLTRQIELYRLEHGGKLPNIDHANRDDRSTGRFVQRLTSRTDAVGRVAAAGDYGPYLMEWPANPFSDTAVATKILFGTDATSPRDGTTGWYYNTKTGALESGGTANIAMWLLDTDYDGRSLFPRQVFFPMAGEKEGWSRLAKNLKVEIDKDLIEAYRGTVSLPFEPGDNRRIAVKIIDDRGIESLKIIEVM